MFVKFTALLALAITVYGDASFLECLQKSIEIGIPEIDLPSHEPLHIPHNFTINRTIGAFEVEADITNLVWANLPWWDLTELSLATDGGSYQVWNWGLYWDFLNITAKYDMEVHGLLVHYELEGDIIIQMNKVNWTGIYNFSLATETTNETLNTFTIDWENGDVSVEITHLELLEKLFEVSFKAAFQAFIAFGNTIDLAGQLFQYQINNKWLADPDRITYLKSWCANQTSLH